LLLVRLPCLTTPAYQQRLVPVEDLPTNNGERRKLKGVAKPLVFFCPCFKTLFVAMPQTYLQNKSPS
jgi:hypothetical protein